MNESKRDSLTRLELVDFLVEQVEYLDKKDPFRVRCEKIIEDAENDRALSVEVLKSAAKEIGRATWANRMALKAFLKTSVGASAEWKGIAAAVRNSTEHLLERFKAGTKVGSIDEALNHAESSSALTDSERLEIREVRTHLWPVLLHTHLSSMSQEINAAKKKLEEIQKRFSILRDMAFTDPEHEKQILKKIEDYEDQLFGAGEDVALEILDDEIAFFRDMKGEEGT
jgi:hypothetical protein